MEFELEGRCVIKLEHVEGMSKSQHINTKLNLEVSDNLDKSQYFDDSDLPNSDGSKALTQVFVQGLIGNIHHAHEKGYWDSAEHIRYIIAELGRGFIEVPNISEGTF